MRSPMDPQPTIKEWLTLHPVTLVVLAGPYESKDDDGWVHDAYRLRLEFDDRTNGKRTTPEFSYRMGVGHRKARVGRWATQEMKALKEPPLPDVLDSLISDASCYDNARDFADFANDLGYDSDSIKAEALYRACGEVLRWLTTFVGGRAELEKLMYETERL
jgi:hypothetical protein